MICSNCGKANGDDFSFCAGCGALLRDPLRQTLKGAAPRPGPSASGPGDDLDPLLGHVIDGRYRLDSKLGSGGMGAVYRATRLSIGDAAAVKVLHQGRVADPQAAERFRREAQTAARLKHPNAVGVYDFGVSPDGLMYLVMELVEGESLREAIERHGALPLAVVGEVAAQVCSALDEAHRLGIIHRDIKPDNIVLQESRAGLRVKVLDFGIAKLHDAAQSKLTQTGGVIGTPHYMSPEQCMGEELDQRSDVYSLGVVLYEMLRGTVPFDSPTTSAVIVQQVTQAPPPLFRAAAGVTPAVEGVVMRALEKRREARQQTAAELARELSDAVRGTSGLGQTTVPINPSGAATSPITRQTPWVPTTAVAPRSPSGDLHAPPTGSATAPAGPAAAGAKWGRWPLALAAVLLLTFAAGALGVLAWLRLSRAEDKAEKVEPTAMAKRLDSRQPPAPQADVTAGRNVSAPPPPPPAAPTPAAVDSADEEINSLRARRVSATASELPGVASALADAERRHPADYRFPYERAKLFVTGRDHHQSFELLATAARKAIAGGAAEEMLGALALDAGGDFRRLAGGHREWDSITEALRGRNPAALKGHAGH
jgi:serine/threonine protein kinase